MKSRVSISAPFKPKVLHEHGAVREREVAVGANGDRRAVRDRKPSAPSWRRRTRMPQQAHRESAPDAGWLGFCVSTQPVSDSSVGTGGPDEPPPRRRRRSCIEPPPLMSTTYSSPSLPWPNDAMPRSGVEQLLRRVAAAAVSDEPPDAPAAVVGEEVNAGERRQRTAAVNVAAGDGVTVAVVVLDHGLDEARRLRRASPGWTAVACCLRGNSSRSCRRVATRSTSSYASLADVADPQLARRGVEAPAPRIAHTPRVDLLAVAGRRWIGPHVAPLVANGLSAGIVYGRRRRR